MERRPIEYKIIPGARVMVDTKENPGKFAWATVAEIIKAVKITYADLPEYYPHRAHKKNEPGMDLFLSTTAFTLTGYDYHSDTIGHYDPGTYFFATQKREGEVERIVKEKKKSTPKVWKQPSLKM
ncbi:MAG: hypothetical protein NTV98_06260 [Candidatus Roizmanbacteria bacterium]|nr:hypothetical protein [Candidatus Roizmanbacteria bacterium]